MIIIEFQAHIKDGIIEIPEEYRDQLTDSVRVILSSPQRASPTGIIARLLEHPIQDSTFVPMKRDEIYGDRT